MRQISSAFHDHCELVIYTHSTAHSEHTHRGDPAGPLWILLTMLDTSKYCLTTAQATR